MKYMKFTVLVLSFLGVVSEVYSAESRAFVLGKQASTDLGKTMVWEGIFNGDCKNACEFFRMMNDSIVRKEGFLQERTEGKSFREYIEGYISGLTSMVATVANHCSAMMDTQCSPLQTPPVESPPSPKKSPIFNLGKNASSELAKSTWKSLGENCNELAQFDLILKRAYEAATEAEFPNSGGFEVFLEGYKNGIASVREDIVAKCPPPPVVPPTPQEEAQPPDGDDNQGSSQTD